MSLIQMPRTRAVDIDEESSFRISQSSDKELSLWYKALLYENCKEVRKLLDENPELLKIGWRRDDTLKVTYIAPFSGSSKPKGHPWKGRTALHVAVNKGWAQLVTDILSMATDTNTTFDARDGPDPLEDLLLQRDGYCGLNALAMAVIRGNGNIISILCDSSLRCQNNPYEIVRKPATDARSSPEVFGFQRQALRNFHSQTEDSDFQLRSQGSALAKDIEKTWKSIDWSDQQREHVLKLYEEDVEFNFLPWQEYIFHFICKHIVPDAENDNKNENVIEERNLIRMIGGQLTVDKPLELFAQKLIGRLLKASELLTSEFNLVNFLFQKQDSQGRTPLHVAVDNFTVPQVLRWIPPGDEYEACLNAVDAAGRTPLYTAAAIRRVWYIQVEMLVKDPRTDVNAVFSPPVKNWPFDIDNLSQMNGYKGFLTDEVDDHVEYSATALHMAIIRGNGFSLECLLRSEKLDRYASFRRDVEFDGSLSRFGRKFTKFWSTPLQLAAMLSPTDSRNHILEYLLKDDRFYDPGRLKNLSQPREGIDTHSALHYAAFSKNSEAVKMILASNRFDCFTTDDHNNTALHFGVDVRGKPVRTHLLDRVNCWWTEFWNLGVQEADLDEEEYIEFQRQQTIDHLIQAGMDLWKVNAWGNRPNPGPWASRETRSRWDKIQAIRILEVQTSLNSAGGAISVTAALVATASFIGPLQPAMGYDDEHHRIRIDSLPVRIFTVSDTMSFYLAIAAIMLALIPSLPKHGGAMPSLISELQQLQTTMLIAALFLFLSILNVLAAFAAASVAAVSVDDSWDYGGLTVSSAAGGGLICVVVMMVCLYRLLKPMLHHHPSGRKFYRWFTTTFDRVLPSAEKDLQRRYNEARRILKQESDLGLRVDRPSQKAKLARLDEAYSSDEAHSEHHSQNLQRNHSHHSQNLQQKADSHRKRSPNIIPHSI